MGGAWAYLPLYGLCFAAIAVLAAAGAILHVRGKKREPRIHVRSVARAPEARADGAAGDPD